EGISQIAMRRAFQGMHVIENDITLAGTPLAQSLDAFGVEVRIDLIFVGIEAGSQPNHGGGKESSDQRRDHDGKSMPRQFAPDHAVISPSWPRPRAYCRPARGRPLRRGGPASWNTCGGLLRPAVVRHRFRRPDRTPCLHLR